MISLEKIENILKTSTNNDLTKEQRKELEELMINCEQITEIDNPQKIDIYIKTWGVKFYDKWYLYRW